MGTQPRLSYCTVVPKGSVFFYRCNSVGKRLTFCHKIKCLSYKSCERHPKRQPEVSLTLKTVQNPICFLSNTSRVKGLCDMLSRTVLLISRQLFWNHFIMLDAHMIHAHLLPVSQEPMAVIKHRKSFSAYVSLSETHLDSNVINR